MSIAATARARHGIEWTVRVPLSGETSSAPEIGVEFPLSDIHADAELPPDHEAAAVPA